MTTYFDVYSPSITEYENEDVPKIHLNAEEHPWDPSAEEYSHREPQMLDHQGQSSTPVTVARGPAFVTTVISYSLAYDAADVMDIDNVATALSAQIQVSVVLIGMVQKT